jgi:hypothetical protein
MKTAYRIIDAKDFIRARPSGEIDLEKSKKVFIELATMAKLPGDYEILLDIRKAYGNLTFTDIYELVNVLSQHRSAFRNKIAILTRDDEQFDRAGFMELCASFKGFKVGAFMSFEETIDWLQSSGGLEDLSEY